MLSEYFILYAILLSFAFGIAAIVFVSRNRHSKVISRNNCSVEERILPFIEVHKSLLFETEEEVTSKSKEALKLKIEGFKTRNQFYKF